MSYNDTLLPTLCTSKLIYVYATTASLYFLSPTFL